MKKKIKNELVQVWKREQHENNVAVPFRPGLHRRFHMESEQKLHGCGIAPLNGANLCPKL